MAKYIKSVTLVAGEKFVLPPLAILKGATDQNAFTSTCPVPILETITCYVGIIGGGFDDGDFSQMFEGEQAYITGYTLSGVDTTLEDANFYRGNGLGIFDTTGIGNWLKSNNPGIIAIAGGFYAVAGRGALSYVLIQTVPSIANNLKLQFRGTVPDDNITNANSAISFVTLAAATTAGYQNLPACPDITPDV